MVNRLSNSNKVEKLGIGLSLNPKMIQTTIIKISIEKIIYDSEYVKKASHVMEISNKLDGINNIKNIVFSSI